MALPWRRLLWPALLALSLCLQFGAANSRRISACALLLVPVCIMAASALLRRTMMPVAPCQCRSPTATLIGCKRKFNDPEDVEEIGVADAIDVSFEFVILEDFALENLH